MSAPRTIAASALVAFALLLTGCSAGGGSSESGSAGSSDTKPEAEPEVVAEQSVDEACAVVKVGLEEMVEALTGPAAADPGASAAALKNAQTSMATAAAEVTNSEVATAASTAAEALGVYNVYVDSVVADPLNADLSKMTEQGTLLQTGMTDLNALCSPAA